MNQCPKHNLPEQIVCIGEMCPKRIGCQLCIDKHDHKFYLDSKCTKKNIQLVKEQIMSKLSYLTKYTEANVTNLKLENYKQKIQEAFLNQLLFFKNKIDEEMISITLWIEKITKTVNNSMQQSKRQIIQNWGKYYANAQKQLQAVKQYEQLDKYFREGDWGDSTHVDKSVGFLYSEQLFFRFNRNLDALKSVINIHKKQDKILMDWFENRRDEFLKLQICPHRHFEQIIKKYDNKPNLSVYTEPKTKQFKDDRASILQIMKQDSKALLLYPQTMYQPFQNIFKIIRYDNQIFVTSGSRAINIWTRVSTQPQKSYQLNFPSYGILSFVQYGKDEAEQVVYGKSNGQMGIINIKKQTQQEMVAHQSTIREIVQYDSYHFLTASQDWKIKLWAMSTEKQKFNKKNFASERMTLNGHSGRIYTMCKFGPSILAAGSDGTIKLWDIQRQSFDQVFNQQKDIYALCEIKPELFASGGELKQIRIWDYRKTKGHICKYPLENSCNTILRYDDHTIVFNDKNVIKVIDIRNTKQPIQRMTNDKTFVYGVNSMAYLSDNQIGMGGNDNVVSIWKY